MALINTNNPVELSRALVLAYRPQTFFRRMCRTITHATKSFICKAVRYHDEHRAELNYKKGIASFLGQ